MPPLAFFVCVCVFTFGVIVDIALDAPSSSALHFHCCRRKVHRVQGDAVHPVHRHQHRHRHQHHRHSKSTTIDTHFTARSTVNSIATTTITSTVAADADDDDDHKS